MLPIGVANCNRGREGLAAICPGICSDRPPVGPPPFAGLTFGEGGMARPNLGVRVPLVCRLPGIGGRNSGAGEDILGWNWESMKLDGFELLAYFPNQLQNARGNRREGHKIGIRNELHLQCPTLQQHSYFPSLVPYRYRCSPLRVGGLASVLPSTTAADRLPGVRRHQELIVIRVNLSYDRQSRCLS